MQKSTLVTAVVTAVVFAGAGYIVGGARPGKVTILKHPHAAKSCRGQDCDIQIKFDCADSVPPSAGTCEPYAEFEVISTDKDRKIKFALINPASTTNYIFDPTDGIKFTGALSGNPNFSSYFSCAPQTGGGPQDKFTCKVDIPSGTPPDVYKYAIHIQGFSIVDPWVVNY